MKVGLFALVSLAVIAYATLKVNDKGIFKGGDYAIYVILDSAEGLTQKTPVEVAGIQVGYIEELELVESRRAKVKLRLNREVRLGPDAVAQVRTKGFLGETYIDLMPGRSDQGAIPEGGQIAATNPYVDLGRIIQDVREVTQSLKEILASETGPVPQILKNMEVFSKKMAEMSVQNQESVNRIVANLAQFSTDLRDVSSSRKESLKDTMDRLNNIARKVDEGHGSLGRLLNDEETSQNINDAARGISETIGGINRFQTDLGYHVEYLGETGDFKNYVGLALKPRPDKSFLMEFVVDPNPSPVQTLKATTVTSGAATTTVTTDENVIRKDKILFSAQLAKQFHDVTLRGGLIESTGGVGVDYNKGPFGLQLSAFDFKTDNNQRPHLKALGSVNLTKNFFVVSGVDDIISKRQNPDWFFGAGLRLVDNDLKSLLGAASLK